MVAYDSEDHLVGVPCLASSGVGGTYFLVIGGCGTCWDDWVGRRFNMWDVKRLPIACQVDGWILEKAYRWPLLCPNGQEMAMRLADSLRMTVLICLWVGLQKTRVRIG